MLKKDDEVMDKRLVKEGEAKESEISLKDARRS